MDDVHDGHSDGQTSDGQGSHTLSQKHTVDDIINRGDDVTDDAGQGIHPQQTSDTLCL